MLGKPLLTLRAQFIGFSFVMGQACFRCIERDDDPNLLKAPRQVTTAKAHLITEGPLLKCSDGIVNDNPVGVRKKKIRSDNSSWHSFGTIRSAMSEEDIRDQDKLIDEYLSPNKNINFTYSPRVPGRHWRTSGRTSFTGDDIIDTEWVNEFLIPWYKFLIHN